MFNLDFQRVCQKNGHKFVELARIIRNDPDDIQLTKDIIEANYQLLHVIFQHLQANCEDYPKVDFDTLLKFFKKI